MNENLTAIQCKAKCGSDRFREQEERLLECDRPGRKGQGERRGMADVTANKKTGERFCLQLRVGLFHLLFNRFIYNCKAVDMEQVNQLIL